MIDKYCGLFLTAGEKRLGHHFFRGFSFILDKLFKDDFAIKENFNFIDNFFLKKAFQQIKRVDSDEAFNENFDEMQFLLNDSAFEVNHPDSNYNNLFDFVTNILTKKGSKFEEETKENSNYFLNHIREFIKDQSDQVRKYFNDSIKKRSLEIIDEIEEYFKLNNLNIFTCLIILLSQIAFESGMIKKCLEINELIWGTYEFHCNAHLDNLLLIKKNKNCRLLSPIDFDLAYYKNEFIDIKYKNLKGIEAQVTFDDLMLREKNYLLIQLLGINPIPNIDVDIPYFRNVIEKLEQIKINKIDISDIEKKIKFLENLEVLIKENVSLYYSKGIHECKESEVLFNKYYDINYKIMELILIIEALIL